MAVSPSKFFKVTISFSLIIAQSVIAEDFYCDSPKGFLWYTEEPVKPTPEKATPAIKKHPANPQALAATERNAALKQKLDDAIQVMLDNPTLENAIIAQRIQKEVMDRSEAVAKSWVLASLADAGLITPETNPNVLHRELAQKEKAKTDTDKLKTMAQDWGLFFYVSEKCIYCQRFAPMVKAMQKDFGFQVLAVSSTGMDFAGFEGKADTGFLDHLNPERVTPVLYLVHQDGKRIYPVARGLTDSERLKANILMMYKLDMKQQQKNTHQPYKSNP